jgi:hypothetical protein
MNCVSIVNGDSDTAFEIPVMLSWDSIPLDSFTQTVTQLSVGLQKTC